MPGARSVNTELEKLGDTFKGIWKYEIDASWYWSLLFYKLLYILKLIILKLLTWTILGICLPVINRPSRSMTNNDRSLIQPDFRPNIVPSIEFMRTGPSDLIGYAIKSLTSPTFRHVDGGRGFCLFVHHHQMKKTAVPAPTAAAVTYANRVLSDCEIYEIIQIILHLQP